MTVFRVITLQEEAETSLVSLSGDKVPPFLKSPRARAQRRVKITPGVSSNRTDCRKQGPMIRCGDSAKWHIHSHAAVLTRLFSNVFSQSSLQLPSKPKVF